MGETVAFLHKDLIELESLTPQSIEFILNVAEACKRICSDPVRRLTTLKGRVMVNLFYEASTRTRTSFELAGKFLGADVVNIASQTSSVTKGESLRDTAKTLEALGARIVVIRHSASGAAHLLAKAIDAHVVNAGDGWHEHPTQGLLDLFTIRERKGRIAGLRVTILGDILHSRVARSNIWGLTKLGAAVTVCGPPTLIPQDIEALGVRVTHSLADGLADADVVNVLRIQLERQARGLFPSVREYARAYGLTRERLRLAKPDLMIMHPGPANLGVEITEEVADDPRASIRDQVTNGVAVRMAVLHLLAGGSPNELAD